MANPEHVAAAANLQRIAALVPPEEFAAEIRRTMRREYIKGGISAMSALIDSVPVKVLELPEEQRLVVSAVVTIVENFIEKMKEQLEGTAGQ
jgi:hypothetical protein